MERLNDLSEDLTHASRRYQETRSNTRMVDSRSNVEMCYLTDQVGMIKSRAARLCDVRDGSVSCGI